MDAGTDTIVAIATAAGAGGVGIVRLSGPRALAIASAITGRALQVRVARHARFEDEGGATIDDGIALHFRGPASFTGEDVVELQAHGSPVVLQQLVARCVALGARQARAGEFSERAFLNGKLDLAQAEAIADLIDASTEAAARSASRSLTGAFSAEIHGLRDALVHLRMLVEATLDFPEEDIDFLQKADAAGQLANLQLALAAVMQRARHGALLREGIKVVIAGQPNAGKSSLLNALAGAELAIVTPIAGTTRDKVQQTIQIEGVPLHIIDTAGLRESDDAVERIGIARAWDEIAGADAVLFLHDLERLDAPEYIAEEQALSGAISQKLSAKTPVIDVWNKRDTAPDVAVPAALLASAQPRPAVYLSARTGAGLDELRRLLLAVAGWQAAPEGLYIARARHVQALQAVGEHLTQAEHQLRAQSPALDLLAEELRLAQNALSAITGEFTSDDLLGVIFSSFCIGK